MINVHFEAMDRQSMALVKSAEKMAKFLRENEAYMRPFCDILRDSAKWRYINCKKEMEDFKCQILKKRKKSKTDNIYITLLGALFGHIRSDDDLNNIRGIMPEQILLCQVEQDHCRNDGWRIETGCAVKINNQKIVCKTSAGYLEKIKQTVDLGAWQHNQQIGRFVEAKVAPGTFRKPDGDYLKSLRAALRHYQEVQFKIYIFAIDRKELVRNAVSQAGYDIDVNTEIIGRDDVFQTNFLDIRSEES